MEDGELPKYVIRGQWGRKTVDPYDQFIIAPDHPYGMHAWTELFKGEDRIYPSREAAAADGMPVALASIEMFPESKLHGPGGTSRSALASIQGGHTPNAEQIVKTLSATPPDMVFSTVDPAGKVVGGIDADGRRYGTMAATCTCTVGDKCPLDRMHVLPAASSRCTADELRDYLNNVLQQRADALPVLPAAVTEEEGTPEQINRERASWNLAREIVADRSMKLAQMDCRHGMLLDALKTLAKERAMHSLYGGGSTQLLPTAVANFAQAAIEYDEIASRGHKQP